jgi:peptidoglycan hydrolase-like protein with peptidoglycan-binding domain
VRVRRPVGGALAALALAAPASLYLVQQSSGATGRLATAPAAALPTANMEAILLAAQRDPVKSSTAVTSGSGPSVLLVERALVARHLLARTYVDGHFGSATVKAYAAYQRSLGYRGLAANGLPGRTSLTKLGTGRFRVVRTVVPGARVTYRGVTVNTRTRAMLREAQDRLDRSIALTQGSYHKGVGASAGTHDGGGVVDVSVSGMSSSTRTRVVRELRTVGFAAWYRAPIPGVWGAHIHAVAVSDPELATQAQAQVGDYYLGRDGLAGHGPDNGPKVPKRTWEDYQRAR